MVHKFKIVCEVCGTVTYDGVLVTDRGNRLRLYCSEKCLEKKDKQQQKEWKDKYETSFLEKIRRKYS